jgi:phosphate transport system substrate-binding protein
VLRGEGSTFVEPVIRLWAGEYERKTGVKVVYKGTGSSAGVREMIGRHVDFGGTDAPMSDAQLLEAAGAGGEVLHVPLVMGAVVATYNLPGLTRPIVFTGPVLANIYLGKVTAWNDPEIALNNPGVKLPNLPITVVRRKEGSGTTHIWTEYLSKVSGEWKERVGTGTTVKWPVGVEAEKSNGVAAEVSKTVGAIGYVELTFALKNGLAVGAVKNAAGEDVVPSLASVTAAAANALGTIPADFRYSLTNASGAASYPIAGTSWAVLYVNPPGEKGKEAETAARRQALLDFLRWSVHDGQALVVDLKYAPLPADLVKRIDARLDQVAAK